jgi:hypothetical protein
MALPTPQSPTHAAPRITEARFTQLLNSKDSPAVDEAAEVWDILLANGVDPSFALAQFRVESQYGTAGYAKETGSWGNMLYDRNLTILSGDPITKTTSSGAKYTYATYDTYVDAVTDFCRYLAWYRDRYGLEDIYGACARWLGREPGSAGHVSYVNIIISDMIAYENLPGEFYETGDKMIYGGPSFDRKTAKIVQKYPVTVGMELYRGTNGDLLKKYQGTPGDAYFLGPVNGSWEWGVIGIGTSSADADITWVYIKKPDKTKVKTVA